MPTAVARKKKKKKKKNLAMARYDAEHPVGWRSEMLWALIPPTRRRKCAPFPAERVQHGDRFVVQILGGVGHPPPFFFCGPSRQRLLSPGVRHP